MCRERTVPALRRIQVLGAPSACARHHRASTHSSAFCGPRVSPREALAPASSADLGRRDRDAVRPNKMTKGRPAEAERPSVATTGRAGRVVARNNSRNILRTKVVGACVSQPIRRRSRASASRNNPGQTSSPTQSAASSAFVRSVAATASAFDDTAHGRPICDVAIQPSSDRSSNRRVLRAHSTPAFGSIVT